MSLSYSIILLAFLLAASSHGAPIDNLSTISPVGPSLADTLLPLTSASPLDGLPLVNPRVGDNGLLDLDSLPVLDSLLPGLLSKRSSGILGGEVLQSPSNVLTPAMGVVNNVIPGTLGSVPVLGNINPLSTVNGLLPLINLKRSFEQLPTEALSPAMGLIENEVPATLSSVPVLENINPLSTVDGLLQMTNLKRNLDEVTTEALSPETGLIENGVPATLGSSPVLGNINPLSTVHGLLPILNLKRSFEQVPSEVLAPAMGLVDGVIPATSGTVSGVGNILHLPNSVLSGLL